MDLHVKRAVAAAMTVVALALSAGCGNSNEVEPVSSESTVPASREAPLAIEEVLVLKAGAPDTSPPEPLTSQDDIRVLLRTNSASGSDADSIEVKLFDIANGREVGAHKAQFISERPGMAEVIFGSNSNLSPGRYMIEIKIDGELAGQRDVDLIELPSEGAGAG